MPPRTAANAETSARAGRAARAAHAGAPKQPEGWERFYRVARRIPRGRVATYGAIAEWAGWPRAARQVGYAMAALHGTEHDVPWHRVLGAATRARAVITIKDPVGGAIQRERLEAEGVEFDLGGRISLERFGWRGPRVRPMKLAAKPSVKPAAKRPAPPAVKRAAARR